MQHIAPTGKLGIDHALFGDEFHGIGKNVADGSLRDNMSQMELLITSLAELTTSELHKSNNSHGLDELNEDAVKSDSVEYDYQIILKIMHKFIRIRAIMHYFLHICKNTV